MEGSFPTRRGTSPFAVRCTTLLACLWGSAAAYILCHSLIVTHNKRYTVAALVSLITVWATLERKRWGRMALIGVSVTTIGIFGFFVSAFSAFPGSSQPSQVRTLHKAVAQVAAYYGISLPVVFGFLLLAVVSSLWLCRAEVVTEFEQHKRPVLVSGQRVIATALIACWGAAIALNPMLPFQLGHAPSTPRIPLARPRQDAGHAHAAADSRSHAAAHHAGKSRKRAPRRAAASVNKR